MKTATEGSDTLFIYQKNKYLVFCILKNIIKQLT